MDVFRPKPSGFDIRVVLQLTGFVSKTQKHRT